MNEGTLVYNNSLSPTLSENTLFWSTIHSERVEQQGYMGAYPIHL